MHRETEEVQLGDTLGDSAVVQVECGHNLDGECYTAVTDGGALYTWGYNGHGQLGHGDTSHRSRPTRVEGLEGQRITAVACTGNHTAAMIDGGALYTWGWNKDGQLGHGDTSDRSTPTRVEGLEGQRITAVSCGYHHTVAMTDGGTLYTWGRNDHGSLGHGDTSDRSTPSRVDGLASQRIIAVACGGWHTAAITDGGALYTWGWNKDGQLGHGDTGDRSTPTRVEGLAGQRLTAVCGGFRCTVALTDDGALYTWGYNGHGQLGHGDTSDRSTPTRVEGLEDQRIIAVSCRDIHTAAMTGHSLLQELVRAREAAQQEKQRLMAEEADHFRRKQKADLARDSFRQLMSRIHPASSTVISTIEAHVLWGCDLVAGSSTSVCGDPDDPLIGSAVTVLEARPEGVWSVRFQDTNVDRLMPALNLCATLPAHCTPVAADAYVPHTAAAQPLNAVDLKRVKTAMALHADEKYDQMCDVLETLPDGHLTKSLSLALAFASAEYVEEAETALAAHVQTEPFAFDPLFLLAAARLLVAQKKPDDAAALVHAVGRYRCMDALLSDADKAMLSSWRASLTPNPAPAPAPVRSDAPGAAGVVDEWEQLKTQFNVPCAAMDELMALIGLEQVKRHALRMYTMLRNAQELSVEQRPSLTLNYVFLGNPGTGKTTVARLFGQMLHEIGARRRNAFIEKKGHDLLTLGPGQFNNQVVRSAMGGVLFIDEAQELEPESSSVGRDVVNVLMRVAEDHRDDITIILGGYKDEMDNFVSSNPGLSSRFPHQLLFADFLEAELREIFESLVLKKRWQLDENGPVAMVAARRLARGSGHRGFANARTVRTMFEMGCTRALERGPIQRGTNPVLTMVDVLGPSPDPEHNAHLKDALQRLDGMFGWDSIKTNVEMLLQLTQSSYQRELVGDPPLEIPLNRLLLGNPGTGKTTCAAIYGAILQHTGMLTDGSVVSKTASDFVGDVVGQSQTHTRQILEQCRGKVLVIDEAYNLDDNNFGSQVLDTIVERVSGAPGEDIAVLMLGYEDQILRMLRNRNPGLRRRFNPENAFRFGDYQDHELRAILRSLCKKQKLQANFQTLNSAIKLLGKERVKPNFGNAGAVSTLLGRAKERMVHRDPRSSVLTSEDFLPHGERADDPDDPLSLLDGLYKIDHIRAHLSDLMTILQGAQRDGRPTSDIVRSYVFLGNPGTGKTTIARIMGEMLYKMGLLASKTSVETSALNLQAGYVGQTKDKVLDVLNQACGGVLFIDEAYELGQGHFTKEALDTLVAELTTEKHHGKTIVVLAGYKREMDVMMQTANPGLISRFQSRLSFPDWSPEDCAAYVSTLRERDGYAADDPARAAIRDGFQDIHQRPGWANARDANELYRFLVEQRYLRLKGEAEPIPRFTLEDVKASFTRFQSNRPMGHTIHPTTAIPQGTMEMQQAPPEQPPPSPRMLEGGSSAEATESHHLAEEDREEQADDEDAPPPAADHAHATRDAGVSDADWAALQNSRDEQLRAEHARVQAIEAAEAEARRLGAARAAAEAARQEEEATRLAAEAHRLLQRAEALRREREQEARAQARLREMGVCPIGFAWIRMGGGYRCAGGGHWVSADQLGL